MVPLISLSLCLQPFQVVATESLNPVALEADVDGALATEKLDGTCCYVTVYKGQPHLWARLDRKTNKQADRRFKKYRHAHRSSKGGFYCAGGRSRPPRRGGGVGG